MKPVTYHVDRLVKSEDLNHHHTLFAGRCAEWFVEAGFIAAASLLPPENIVCFKIHGLEFTHPVQSGEIARFKSKVIRTGRTSLVAYVTLALQDQAEPIVNGFITFVHVNQDGTPMPHNLKITLEDPADQALNQIANNLR